MQIIITFFIINIIKLSCTKLSIPEEPEQCEGALKFIKDLCITSKNCMPGIIFSNNSEAKDLVTQCFIQTFRNPLITMGLAEKSFPLKINMVIAVVTNQEDFSEVLEILKKNPSFDVQDKAIFIINWNLKETEARSLVEKMWSSSRLLNFVIVDRKKVLSYNPFLNNGTLLKYDQRKRNKHAALFPDKLRNLHGHKFKVSVFELLPRYAYKDGHYFGPDVNLLERILRRVSATYCFIEPQVKTKEDDGDEDVIAGRTDFSILRVFVSHLSQNSVYKFAYPYTTDDLVAVVPKSSLYPDELHVASIFQHFFFVFALVIILLMAAILTIRDKIFGNTDNTDSYFEVLRVVLNGMTPNFWKINDFKKVVFVICMRLSIMVGVYLQISLTGNLVAKRHMKNIDTIAQLEQSNLTILLPKYYSDEVPAHLNLHKHFVYTTAKQDVWSSLVKAKKNLAYVMPHSTAKLVNRLTQMKFGKKVYHICNQHLVPGFSCYIFPTNSPYLKKIDHLIASDRENGFRFGTQYDAEHLNAVMNLTTNDGGLDLNFDYDTNRMPTVLTLSHLYVVFVVLALGYVVSFIAFLFEICQKPWD